MGTKEKLIESIMLHKPHPGNIIKSYALKQVYDELKNSGYIKDIEDEYIKL